MVYLQMQGKLKHVNDGWTDNEQTADKMDEAISSPTPQTPLAGDKMVYFVRTKVHQK